MSYPGNPPPLEPPRAQPGNGVLDRHQGQEFGATDLIAPQDRCDRSASIGEDAVNEEDESLPQRLDLSSGFGDFATQLELGVLETGGGAV